MKQEQIKLNEIKIAGMTVRSNNETEFRKLDGKIFPCVQQYFHKNVASRIPNRVNAGRTLCGYTDYESDHNGDYTYFIGEEVSSFDSIPDELTTLVIPAQNYTKFTNGPAAMPEVIADAWQEIWEMSNEQMGGERAYHADFEVYDERAADHNNIVLDIFVGLK